jgi:hypothetical protein
MFRARVCISASLLLACCILPLAAQQPLAASSNANGSDVSNRTQASGTKAKVGSPSPLAVGGSGTADFIPMWTGPTTLANSNIFQTIGGLDGIATTAPAAKLDVNGTGIFRNTLTLFPKLTNPTLLVHGTAFAISSAGKVTFVGGQTFPGTGTVTSVGSGFGLTGGPITKTGSLAINTSIVPQLAANNVFSGAQTINNNLTVTGNETFTGPIQFTDTGVAGQVETALLVNSVDCCNFGNRMIWAHSPAFSGWGIYYDDSVDVMHWQQAFGGPDLMTLDFDSGNLNVTGAITAGVKDFRIDHPLDPTNKYLYHTSVESSEMMNIYTGNATLGYDGEAAVTLPDWFEAVNTDFRYQLTAIGAPAPNLHVAQEIENHQFRIAGGVAGMKVSWQVTGVRHDAYAQKHPLMVEVDKSESDRGHYLHPEAFGESRPVLERMRQLKVNP